MCSDPWPGYGDSAGLGQHPFVTGYFGSPRSAWFHLKRLGQMSEPSKRQPEHPVKSQDDPDVELGRAGSTKC